MKITSSHLLWGLGRNRQLSHRFGGKAIGAESNQQPDRGCESASRSRTCVPLFFDKGALSETTNVVGEKRYPGVAVVCFPVWRSIQLGS